MADSKLSALSALSPILATDIIYVVSDPGGTPASMKVTVAQLFTNGVFVTPTLGVAAATSLATTLLVIGARASGVAPYLQIRTPVDTGQTLNTEFPGIVFGGDSSFATVIRTGADGTTYALQREFIFVKPTYAFAGATTITDAATLAITGAPVLGTNATITRRSALLIDAATNDTWASFGYAGSEFVRFGLSSTSGYGMFAGAANGNNGAGFAVSGSPLIVAPTTWEVKTGSATFITGSNAANTVPTLTINSVGYTTKPGIEIDMTAAQTANPLQVKDSGSVTLFQVAPSGAVLCGVKDAGTITVTNGLTIGHQSTGTPDVGLGGAVLFNINSSTTADQNAGQVATLWTVATHATRTAKISLRTVTAAVALAEVAQFQNASASVTRVLLEQQLVGQFFSKTADTTVGGTTTETDLTGTGVGTVTLPINFLTAGKTVRVRAKGHFSTDAISPATLNIRLRLGGVAGTVIVATGDKTPAAACTSEFWEVDIDLTCRTIGATGTVMAAGNFYHGDDSTNILYEWEMVNTAAVTVDTTAALAVSLSADWGGTDADDTLTCTLLTLESLS